MTTPESTLRKAQELLAKLPAFCAFKQKNPRVTPDGWMAGMRPVHEDEPREWFRAKDVEAMLVRALAAQAGDGEAYCPQCQALGMRNCSDFVNCGNALATQPREQAGAGAVAWQYRVLRDDRCWMQWADWPHDERPEQIGRWKAQYRPLYTHPATPSVSLTEADRVGREMLRYLGDDQPNSDISDKANSHLTVGELRAWANRLTAAPAPTEGGDFVPAKRRAVGPCEADYDPLAFEYARGWNDCVDSIKYNRAKPATPSAADYSDEHFLADCLQMTGYLDAEKATEVAGKLLAFVVDMKRDLATPPMVEAGRGVDDAMVTDFLDCFPLADEPAQRMWMEFRSRDSAHLRRVVRAALTAALSGKAGKGVV